MLERLLIYLRNIKCNVCIGWIDLGKFLEARLELRIVDLMVDIESIGKSKDIS